MHPLTTKDKNYRFGNRGFFTGFFKCFIIGLMGVPFLIWMISTFIL